MEGKNYETRHVYLVVGLLTVLLAPIFLLFIPQTVAVIIHYKRGVWDVLIPNESYIVFGVGFFLIFLACMILFFLNIHKYSIIISASLSILSLGCFYIASQAHVSLSNDTISYTPVYSVKDYHYKWDDVEKITIIDHTKNEKRQYKIDFVDGNHIVIDNNKYFKVIHPKFSKKIREMMITIDAIEK